MINFLCFVVLLALAVKFFRTLAEKWGIIEWLQIHAPNEFFSELFRCEFCQSFWLGVGLCLITSIITGSWIFMIAPIFACNIR